MYNETVQIVILMALSDWFETRNNPCTLGDLIQKQICWSLITKVGVK